MIKVRPNVGKFHSSEYLNALASGEICLVLGWSGDVKQAQKRAAEAKAGIEIGYAIPKGGAQMFFDNFAIPKDAKNVAEAHAFIDYMLRPEVAAKNSNFLGYANGNLASQALIDKSVLDDKTVYPDAATIASLYLVTARDQRTTRADQPAVDQDQDRAVEAACSVELTDRASTQVSPPGIAVLRTADAGNGSVPAAFGDTLNAYRTPPDRRRPPCAWRPCSALVGLSGSCAGGRLPNFSRHAISRKRALFAVRLAAAIWKSVGSAKPIGAPRPVMATGMPLNVALRNSCMRCVRRRAAVGHQPLNHEAGEEAKAELVLDRGHQVDLRRGVVADGHPRDSCRRSIW